MAKVGRPREYTHTARCPACGKDFAVRPFRMKYCGAACYRSRKVSDDGPQRSACSDVDRKTTRDPYPPTIDRLLSKCIPEPNSGCWLWIGAMHEGGYGRVRYHNRTLPAHRVSYMVHVGPIPGGLVIDHKCRVRCCVNPDHLEPVTRKENMRRAKVAWANSTSRSPAAGARRSGG